MDGGWSDYGEWSKCSADCGIGFHTRSRTCTNPAPANGGADCKGQDTERGECNNGDCAGINEKFCLLLYSELILHAACAIPG